MAVSTRLRWEILRRDRFACRYCGARAQEDGAVLEVDHVLPKVLGGKDRADNLVAACEACNSGKGSTHPDSPLIEDVEADALRWARVVKRAGQKMIADRGALADLLDEFEEVWGRWGYGEGDARQPVPIAEGWQRIVSKLLVDGLPMPVLLDCIQESMAQKGRPAQAVFGDACRLSQSKLVQIRRLADGVIRDDQPAPNFAALSVPAFAESLLDYLDDDEREAALDKIREDYDEDVEATTAETVFGNLITERWSLLNAIERLLSSRPTEEVAEARQRARDEFLSYTGAAASEVEVAASTANLVAGYCDGLRYLNSLTSEVREAWIDYVTAWPGIGQGKYAAVIQAAETARRATEDQNPCLYGMCSAPSDSSPIGRCIDVATHSVWIEQCTACSRVDRSDCSGDHLVCEAHLADLIDDRIVMASTGDPIKIRDFAEWSVAA